MFYHIETVSLSLSYQKKMTPHSSLYPKGIVDVCVVVMSICKLYVYLQHT